MPNRSSLTPQCRSNVAQLSVRGEGRPAPARPLDVSPPQAAPEQSAERSLDFRSEFINFFNTPQFDKPGVQLALATFGKITNTDNKGRQVQFTLKLNF
jgi:hypothetical protein